MAVDATIKGRKFGFLTTAYADYSGHRIACRCACSKLVFAAAEPSIPAGACRRRLPITNSLRNCPRNCGGNHLLDRESASVKPPRCRPAVSGR
jgi:hypothetical protein